ncbi:interferon-induced very large GTPase 1-like [Acipenser ruthenus]|uniref:interferon-induced very large GTPase 1-like n=1 Tax=Acipenser ruthenus TaxID=7906 RepID=UPI0027427058|nr:interferon-induced very large GTPase 1-like [Acipenser ruthenus]
MEDKQLTFQLTFVETMTDKPQTDLEVQIKNQGLDPKKWKELLKNEFQVTSIEALQHLNKEDYQKLEKHAEADWERRALAKLVNVDISPKSDEDLEKIEDSGLDTEKWKNILKEEYGITSLVSLQYLKNSDLRLLQKKTEKEWEKRALSRLLNTEIAPKMTQEDEKRALEMRQKISDGLANVTKDLESHLKRIGRDELGNNDLKASADKSLSTLTELMNKMDTLNSNSVKRTEWTPSDLIYRASEGGVFRGILFSNDVKHEQVYRGIILDKPVECCLLGPFLSMQEKSYTFQSSEHESSFESSLKTCGASYSAELHASFAGFSVEAGGGTASSCTDSNKTSRAKAESYGSVIKQTFMPMASFEFTHTQLKLSEDALHVLKEIDDFMSRDLISRQMVVLLQSQAIKFLQLFGSHVNGSVVHFGGIHCVKASSHEVHSSQMKSKFNEMSRSIDAHVKASFSFYGGGGFSASHNNSDARESTGTHETNTSDIDIAVQMIGGPQEACSIPEWKRGLVENQSTWSVIDRGQASNFIPVWNIIMDNHFKNFNDPMGLACILRECWREMVASQARGKGARVDHPKWWDDERIDDLVKNGKEWKSFDITDVTQLWAVKSLENLVKRKKSLTTSENYEEQESQIKVKCERLSSLMDEYMEEEQADDLWKAFGTELISDRPKKETGGQRVAPHIIWELKRIYKDKEEAACRTNKLELDGFLTKGQRIISKNGKYTAIFQDDGNFVVYESPEGVPIWASDTWGKKEC